MKKIFINYKILRTKTTALLLIVVFLTSCSNYLDVNTDPNSVLENPGVYMIPSIEVSIGAVVGGRLALTGSLWAQYYNQNNTANQYRTIIDMQLQANDGDIPWDELYRNALSDIKKLKDYSDIPGQTNPRLRLIATILESYTYQVIFDCYGQAPYSEAIQGEQYQFTPKFENGNEVYPLLISAIDDAIADLEAFLAADPTLSRDLRKDIQGQDYLFNGNISEWIAFANSVKLKIAMRNLDYDNAGSLAVINDLETKNNYITEDVRINIFAADVLKENPLYAMDQNLNTTINLVANRTLSEFWTTNGDLREPLMFVKNTDNNLLLDHGDHRATSTTNPPLSNRTLVHNKIRPVYFMTTSEVDFFRAELIVKGIIGGSAKPFYDNAVADAFYRLAYDAATSNANATQSDIAAVVDPVVANAATLTGLGGNYEFRSTGTMEEQLEDIGVQKWAAMANVNPYEGFLEMHRLDYPEILETMTYADPQPIGNAGAKLYLPKNTVLGTNYIKRYMLPETEQTTNSTNFPAQTKVTDGLWWDIN